MIDHHKEDWEKKGNQCLNVARNEQSRKKMMEFKMLVVDLVTSNGNVKKTANLEFINFFHKNTDGKFSFWIGGREMQITEYNYFNRQGKIPALKKKTKQFMTHFNCYEQSEMTGNRQQANSRHSMCRNPRS